MRVHKTANILNKLPKSQQPKAKRMLQDIWMAKGRDVSVAERIEITSGQTTMFEKRGRMR